MSRYDLIVKNGKLVVPYVGVCQADIGVKGGKIATVSSGIASSDGQTVLDAKGKLVFPGAVDSHYHVGIYRPFSDDAESESRSSLVGGVTTILSYFRTGHHYLNKSGPYARIFPEVLDLSRGHFYTDYGFHIAIMTREQLEEVQSLVDVYGVTSFKFYMFYKGLNLSADSTRGSDYTMAENYDLGHLYQLMQQVARQSVRYQDRARISLSLHCENPELIRVFIEEVKQQGLQGLRAYSESRPPLSERLSVHEAAVLADATGCPINLLHLSSQQALQAAIEMRRRYTHLNVALETTLHHLALTYDTAGGVKGKVNPPIRSRQDADYLWAGIASGEVNTVASDHACCFEEHKKEDDMWSSLPGFGGSSLLYPVLLSEGFHKRGVPLTRIAELVSANPARSFGLYPRKGAIAVGSDADFAIVDLERSAPVTKQALQSAQDFTPFEGLVLKGWPTETILRGQVVYAGSTVAAKAAEGEFIPRPAHRITAERDR